MLSRVVSSPIHGNCSRGICLITSGNVGPPGRAPSRISRSLMRSTPEISLVGVSPPLMTQGRNLRLGGCCFWDADLPNIGIGHSVFGLFVVVSISRYKNILLPVGEEGLLHEPSLPMAASPCGKPPCRPRQVGEGQALLLMRASDVVQIGAEVNDVQALRHS
jgi:hypothetical protein